MLMTGNVSIQDVLLFPQMKPEKKVVVATDEQFMECGVPQEWIALLRKCNINKIEDLQSANPNKLFNDLNGLRKKNKLDIAALKLEEVQAWISK
jgi:lysyl-tRNA synthetase class 2